ncbi:MAG: protease inhibitor I42 family protein [Phycisphaerae bacterium]|nr:protease inhibitor I42 family protein [Phycisphaerae bacterium]
MVSKKNIMVGLLLGMAWVVGMRVTVWPTLPVMAQGGDPFVPPPCSLEGAWIMTVFTPQGPQIQTVTLTAQADNPDQLTAVMEFQTCCRTLTSLMPDCEGKSRFVGLAKKDPSSDWQLTVLGYSPNQGIEGHPSQFLTVISSTDLHCTGQDVMEARISIATYWLRQAEDNIGLPGPDEKPIMCMAFDARFRRVPLLRPCIEVPVSERIEVKVGDEFTVSLDSNPTTGFSWLFLGALPQWLEQTDYQYRPSAHDPGIVGSGGVEEWTYKANAAGITTLLYAYCQPWASDVPPAKTHSVLVVAGERMDGE